MITADAAGTMVDSTLLELNLDAETRSGVPATDDHDDPGQARGGDFTLEPKQ